MTNLKSTTIKKSVRGFTLIELLIVIVIISIVSGVAVLTISHNQNTRFDAVAKQITNILTLAEEQAMLKPAILGLELTDTTFQFYEYDDNATDKQHLWRAVTNKELGLHRIPDGTQLTLKIRDKVIPNEPNNDTPQPHLIISTSGDIIPFTILIGKPGSKPQYHIIGEANGSLSNGPIEP